MRVESRCLAMTLALCAALCASLGHAAVLSVLSNQRPWDTGANPSLPYGSSDPGLPPAVAQGSVFGFMAGDLVQISVLGGSVSAFPPDYPFIDISGVVVAPGNDPNAYVGPVNDGVGSSGTFFPSLYTPADWPTQLMALIGTFADDNGVVVGTPFSVGPQKQVTVPVGATRLQFGLNDDVFGDNGGAFEVDVAAVPEPAAWLALTIGLIGVLLTRIRSLARASWVHKFGH
jgi:hypothetical protein